MKIGGLLLLTILTCSCASREVTLENGKPLSSYTKYSTNRTSLDYGYGPPSSSSSTIWKRSLEQDLFLDRIKAYLK